MVGSLGVVADVFVDLFIALDLRTGRNFFPFEIFHGRLRKYLAREAHPGAHFFAVLLGTHVVKQNTRWLQGVGAGNTYPAPTGRSHRADMRLKSMALHWRAAVITDGHGHKVVLQIRVFYPSVTADKAAGLHMVGSA